MKKNKKVISISDLLYQQFKYNYRHVYNQFLDMSLNKDVDDIRVGGYYTMIYNARDIFKSNPVIATQMFNVVDDCMNNNKGCIQDKNSTNRIVAECIKTNNLNLLKQKYFYPLIMQASSVKAYCEFVNDFSDREVAIYFTI